MHKTMTIKLIHNILIKPMALTNSLYWLPC